MPQEPNKSVIKPVIHRMEGELKVCDPVKTDHTKDMESWRILRILGELVEGFEFLKKYKLAATFFGSARSTMPSALYDDAAGLAGMLAKSGFAIMNGGGSGIMEAASKGAKEAGGDSVGLNIILPHEQGGNKYLTDQITFHYFFTRRVMLSFASEVYIFFPGGFGTMDEFFEILTLVQTGKIKRIPIVLYGKEFWTPWVDLMRSELAEKQKTIDADDLKLFVVVDSVDDAYEKILTLVNC